MNRILTASLFGLLTLGTLSVFAQSDDVQTLTVAQIGASEGRQAQLDQANYQAALLAATQINAGDDDDTAGILNSSTEYLLNIVYYPADTLTEAVEAYDDAVADGAVAIIAPSDKNLAQAILDERTPAVALLGITADAPANERLVRLAASNTDWATTAADYLLNERYTSAIALVITDTNAAIEAADAFRDALGDTTLVADIQIEADEDNLLNVARDIRNSDARGIFVWTLTDQAQALLEELNQIGWEGVVITAQDDPSLTEAAGALEVYSLRGWSALATDGASQAFTADYNTLTGTAPASSAAATYDSIFLLADAISRGGDAPTTILTNLKNAKYTGVQGDYAAGTTSAVRLLTVQSQPIEAAWYTADTCVNCPDLWRADTSEQTVANTETFTIGLITTTEGVTQAQGDQIEQAVRLALREINETGGVIADNTRYTLNLRVYNATTSDEADTARTQASDDGVQIVLGPDSNAQILQAIGASDLVQLVSATSDQIALSDASDTILQLRATDATLLNTVTRYLLDMRDQTRFAFVAARTDYGLDAADAFRDLINDNDDSELVLSLEHDLDQTDFSTMAQEIVDAQVQSVVVWSAQPAAQALIEALDALAWDGSVVYGYLTPAFAASLETTTLELIAPVSWWSDGNTWATQNFTTRYTERYGTAPIAQAAVYYDAVYLLADALTANGSASDTLAASLQDITSFNGVQGTYRPATYANGEMTGSVTIVAGSAAALVSVARYDGDTCLSGCQ